MVDPTQPDQQKVPLLDELVKLASTVLPHEIPHSGQLAPILGAIVKVLEHEGVTIAEDLWPAEPAPPVRAPETPDQAAQFTDLLNRLTAAVTAAEQKAGVSSPEGGSVPPAAPAEPTPVETTVPPAPSAPPAPATPDSAPSTPAEALPQPPEPSGPSWS